MENQEQLNQLKNQVQACLTEALKQGATAAEAGFGLSNGLSVSARLGDVENIEYDCDQGLSVTVYVDKRKGSASSTDLSLHSMRETVKAACSIAKFSNEDAFSGLPDKELLATDCPDLALYHPWQLEAKAAIALAIECETYFAKPYHSWQRGLNENHNGLLRQYFPKKTRLDTLTQHEVDFAIHEMNHRPRKSLNYKTPWEVFFEMSGQYFDSFPSVALVT